MKRGILIGVVAALLAFAPAAFAGSSVLSGYGTEGSKPVVEVKGASTSTPAKSVTKVSSNGAATLPFTGMDLVLFVGAGAALVIVGFGARKLGRDEQ